MTIREKVARAICEAEDPGGCVPGCVQNLHGGRCAYAAAADAALAALPCSVGQLEQIAKGEAMVTLSKEPRR